jgi:hypothetical protein
MKLFYWPIKRVKTFLLILGKYRLIVSFLSLPNSSPKQQS